MLAREALGATFGKSKPRSGRPQTYTAEQRAEVLAAALVAGHAARSAATAAGRAAEYEQPAPDFRDEA